MRVGVYLLVPLCPISISINISTAGVCFAQIRVAALLGSASLKILKFKWFLCAPLAAIYSFAVNGVHAKNILAAGCVIKAFPEHTIHQDGSLSPFRGITASVVFAAFQLAAFFISASEKTSRLLEHKRRIFASVALARQGLAASLCVTSTE